MPMLSRARARPLLYTVNGKSHATGEDHVDQLPIPPETTNAARASNASHLTEEEEEDINCSPVSSEDEGNVNTAAPEQVKRKAGFQVPKPAAETRKRCVAGEKKDISKFRRPLDPTSNNKRSRDPEEDGDVTHSSEAEDVIFGNKCSSPPTTGFTNIHAPLRKGRKVMKYGRKNPPRADSKFSKSKATVHPTPSSPLAPRNKFKMPAGGDVFEFGREDIAISSSGIQTTASLEGARGAEDESTVPRETSSLSPPLSSHSPGPSSPIIECGTTANTTTCPICNDVISNDLTTTFQQTFTQGSRILNYRWQQRFCRWHKQQDATRMLLERGYPEIDWDGLSTRMRRFQPHLRRVITGEEESFYRHQLAEMLSKGVSKTALHALVGEGTGVIKKDGGGVGYYGSRGERVMTEYIISHLSPDIRRQSTRDRLVAAAGVSGGVSGFVQAVLVPELAERLICEDMSVDSVRAREIMIESAEVGELLHPDVNDRVDEVENESSQDG